MIRNTISLSAVKEFLHRHGFKFLKTGSLPAKADPEEQREFYENTELPPLMEKAKRKEIAMYFVDASHFVMGNGHLGSVWSRVRRFISTYTGRVRYNVLGALNYATKELITVTNDTSITSTQVIELLEKISCIHLGFPVYLLLDNVKYQRCKAIMLRAEQLGITLVFLPAYSPNLNLIERFWKLVKKNLSAAFFEKFEDSTKNIDLICASAGTQEMAVEMEKLIGEKVQLFDGLIRKTPTSAELPRKAA